VATSSNFSQTISCNIEFNINYISDSVPKGIYPTGIASNPVVEEVIGTATFTVPLGVSFVGPNITYTIALDTNPKNG